MGFDEDLESGNAFLKVKYKKLLRFYRSPKTKPFFYLFIFVTIILVFKMAYINYKTSETIITIDERPYEAFIVKPEIVKDRVLYKPVVVKTSEINKRMQELNLKDSEEIVQIFLNETNNICIHLSFFGLPFDITVFQNITIMNPTILSESLETTNIKEMDLFGNWAWKKRPKSVYIKFLQIEGLQERYLTLYDSFSTCLLHYNT